MQFNKPYKIHEIPTPSGPLQPHDMLVKIAAASICHTDSMVSSGVFNTTLPSTASHEGCGIVVAVGSSVKDFKAGDRTLCGLVYHRCWKCEFCLGPGNNTQYCPNVEAHNGVHHNGCFADYEIVDARECWHLPANNSFASAPPLACAGITIWGGIVRADLKEGQSLAFVGTGGGLGHLGIQFAKALGLKVIAVDARDEALELAKECGADTVIDARSGKEKTVEEVQKVTGGKGADATILITDQGSAAATAAAITRMQGSMIEIAQPDNVIIPFRELVFRDIKIQGSLLCQSYPIHLLKARLTYSVGSHEQGEKNARNGLEA